MVIVMHYKKWLCAVMTALAFMANTMAAAHVHHVAPTTKTACHSHDITCAKTVTSAFAPNGDLWRLWAHNSNMYFQRSNDEGKSFTATQRVSIAEEKISARNENRPKIAFDKYQGVYLSWASPKEKKYSADIRFAYSNDNGNTFTQPITVNNDNLLTGHSFNELLVTPEGDISIVWLDSRLKYQLRKQGKEANGSALYLARANFYAKQNKFTNQQLANNTCVCCRIAMDFNAKGELGIFWRHIYGDNIREFALMTVNNNAKVLPTPYQISHDHWKINGCPHQGGAISIDPQNRYHLIWFNMGDNGKGIFYANSQDEGKTLTTPLSVGDFNAQAAHPHLKQSGNNVDIVWTQFTGSEHQLWHQKSSNNGQSFEAPKMIATSLAGSDRPFIINHHNKSYVSWHRLQQGHLVQAL